MTLTKIYLQPSFFGEKEKLVFESDGLSASTFSYSGGVAGLRLKNSLGELVILPFQGQQIWSAAFAGRNLTMKSMFEQPRLTRQYLETYGGFLLHCGFTAMGVPTKEDNHPLHGEMPNAPYQEAYLVHGEDEFGRYLAVGGTYKHTVAFSYNYVAIPLVKLYAGTSLFNVSLDVTNLKHSMMEYMYLAHINFRPVNGGQLVYSADVSPQTVRVRRSIPSHVRPGPGYREFLDELALHPEKHHHITPNLVFDPEVVFFVEYLADEAGWAHSMQVHPDGSADYVSHRPAQLDHGVRWICRTPDQDAMGLNLPATAEPEGFSAEKAKGNIKTLSAGETFSCEMWMGVLSTKDTETMKNNIDTIIQSGDKK